MHNSGAEYRIVSLLFNWNIECWMFEQSYLVTNWFILKLILRLHRAELAGLSYNIPHINVVSIHERLQTNQWRGTPEEMGKHHSNEKMVCNHRQEMDLHGFPNTYVVK